MKKRIIALLLSLVMAAGLLAGCTKPMDAQTLVQKMDEALKATTAMAGKMTMDLDMTLGVTGITMEMGIDAEIDMASDITTSKTYMDLTLDMKIFGITQTQNMSMYVAPEGDQLISYTYVSQEDSWLRQIAELPDAEAMQQLNAAASLSEIPAEKLVLAEEKALIGEKEYYVLTVTMDGEYFQQVMDASMDAVMTQMDDAFTGEDGEMFTSMMEGTDWSTMTAVLVYHVDPETFLPVQYSVEVTGLDTVLNSMLSGLLTELTTQMGGEEVEINVGVPVCVVSVTDLTYNDVQVPEVPQEGIEAAALNPLQLDGSFVLRSGEEAVRIVLPEGYTGSAEDSQTLFTYDEEYSVTALYSLVPDAAPEQIQANYEEEITFAQEYEYYESHEYSEYNGFTVLTIRDTYGSASCYCWKQLESGVILTVEIDAFETAVAPDVLLDCIEDYEG